eukprot:scaffold80048_cov43-Cyclotella_meneghiniana.AAC.4
MCCMTLVSAEHYGLILTVMWQMQFPEASFSWCCGSWSVDVEGAACKTKEASLEDAPINSSCDKEGTAGQSVQSGLSTAGMKVKRSRAVVKSALKQRAVQFTCATVL